MAEADAVVVPSRVEPFGIVVLEAWAAGTPVLATCRGGPAGFVTDGHDGLLIDPEDLSSVVTGIDRVIGDPLVASHLVRAGLESAKSFTWSQVAEQYQLLFTGRP
jgi:glycosyltransferase involved in cell wall biosynthesis